MLHFGLTRIAYTVNFDTSCYYPITFEKKRTKVLFGMSFGMFSKNSISISWRPSERLEQIDLFTEMISKGIAMSYYMGTINTGKNYEIKIKRDGNYNVYWVRVSDEENNPQISFPATFAFPLFKLGYTIERKHNHKILLQRKTT